MADTVPHYFADMVVNVSHANGVFRISFAQQGPDRTAKPVVDLMVPGSQMAGMLRGMADAANEIADKLREGAPAASAPAPAKKAPARSTASKSTAAKKKTTTTRKKAPAKKT